MKRLKGLFAVALVAFFMSGCASYRVDSNIPNKSLPNNQVSKNVIISEGSLSNHTFNVIGPIEISVKKLTAFHKDPTKEQANAALISKAQEMGADAVINVTYKSGIGLTTWGYMDAKGTAVKFTN